MSEKYGFQYACYGRDGSHEDKVLISREEAYALYDKYLPIFIKELSHEPEMAIWSGMESDTDYHTKEKYIHCDDVELQKDGNAYYVSKEHLGQF